jgi:hypothetical protein
MTKFDDGNSGGMTEWTCRRGGEKEKRIKLEEKRKKKSILDKKPLISPQSSRRSP